jgi:hypothetical protein
VKFKLLIEFEGDWNMADITRLSAAVAAVVTDAPPVIAAAQAGQTGPTQAQLDDLAAQLEGTDSSLKGAIGTP